MEDMKLKDIVLAPNYPDLWRKRFFYPSVLDVGGSIALIGIGNIQNYMRYDWASVDYKGFDIMFLHHHAANYAVYDIDERAIRTAVSYGINARSCDLCKSPLPQQYDWIFAADVIEHTESPTQFVRNISLSLNQNGTACLTTPNSDFWRNAIPWKRHENPTHFQSFSKHHFINFSKSLAIRIVYLQTFISISPFREDYKPLSYVFHRMVGKVLSYNSLLFVFKNRKI